MGFLLMSIGAGCIGVIILWVFVTAIWEYILYKQYEEAVFWVILTIAFILISSGGFYEWGLPAIWESLEKS